MSTQPVVLSVNNLNISFPQKETPESFTAVDNISFRLERGKVLAVVGESGSGKSLTALALMGLLPADANLKGEVLLYTENNTHILNDLLKEKSWNEIRGKEMGMIFQEPMSSLNPVMKIGKQLSEVMLIHQNISKKQSKEKAIECLQKVKINNPDKIYNRYPHQLSGGQKQRVMIAMAMCNHPVLIIADEPTTALDATVQQEIINLMQDLQKQINTSMIFITHDLALASSMADDVMVLYRGKVAEYGSATNIFNDPKHAYTKALIGCKPSMDNKNKKLPVVDDFMENENSQKIKDQKLPVISIENSSQPIQNIPSQENNAILRIQNLKVWFAESKDWLGKPLHYFKAVDDVSFELKQGEILGLVGESGCGKSTLSKSLIGLIPVHEGQIFFDGDDVSTYNLQDWRKARKNIQMIFQDPYASLNPRMTIGDILMEPMKVHRIVDHKDLKKEAKRLLDLVHLPADSLKRYPHQFSGGQRQRIGIARALALQPKILICDESVSALDVSVQAQILNLLKELQAAFQLSYLFISHDLSVVHYISDRVMVMQAGKIVETGDAVQVLRNPKHDYTKKLVDAMPHLKD